MDGDEVTGHVVVYCDGCGRPVRLLASGSHVGDGVVLDVDDLRDAMRLHRRSCSDGRQVGTLSP